MDCVAHEEINESLKAHATAIVDWRYQELANVLHEWAERFELEFKLKIDIPALRIDRTRDLALGTYRAGRNGFGLRHEITFNTKHLKRPTAELLETLLHELLHEWQELHGKPSTSDYHNVEFRRKAREFGFVVHGRGHHEAVVPGPFTELLARYGVDPSSVLQIPPEPTRTPGASKMKKWSCRCTNVRCAVELRARCLNCGAAFQRAVSNW